MTKDEKSIRSMERRLLKSMMPSFINSLHEDGIISETDLLDKNMVFEKLSDYMEKNKDNIDFEVTVDHRDTIIKVAEEEMKKGNFEFAVATYATFIEHTLNRIIHLACSAKKIDAKTKVDVIKNVTIVGKCTWLIRLLELPPIKKDYIDIIFSIADERNAYIHYKWKPKADKIPDLEIKKKEEEAKIKKIKSLLRYLKNYETKLEYKGKKSSITKLVR